MIKHIIIEPYDNNNKPNIELLDFSVKLASDRPNYIQEIMSKVSPQEGFTYMLGNIVGSDEVWGDNNKHDSFPRSQLNPADNNAGYGYKTFLHMGAPYIEHANQGQHLKVGSVESVHWIPDIERVYVLLKLANDRVDPEYLEALKNFEVGLSMGCKIKEEKCSYCGHISKTSSDRCEHISTKLGSIMPNGVKVKMINIEPKFFDATLTLFPADRTAQMLKAASLRKVASVTKEATISTSRNGSALSVLDSKVINDISDFIPAGKAIHKYDIDIPKEVIASVMPEEFLALMLANGSLPKVKELRELEYIPKKLSSDILHSIKHIPDKLASYLELRSSDRESLLLRLMTLKPEFTDVQPTEKESSLLSTLLLMAPAYYLFKYLIEQSHSMLGAHMPPNVQLSQSTMSALTNPDFGRQVALSRLGIAPPLPSFSYTMPNTVSGLPLAYLLAGPSNGPISKLGSLVMSSFGIEHLFPSEEVRAYDTKLASLFIKK